jgi:serine/threonine protein phosphatase PrpC
MSPLSPRSGMESVDSDRLDELAETTNKSLDSLDQFSKPDFFVVVASDGIWEQISVDEVGRRVAQHGRDNLDSVCETLVNDARRKWLSTKGVADDISVLVAWF